ncbi:MAG: type I DNA topoisomerase [Patescibacteria group bacterium]
MSYKLVIVESPAKAKTIEKYLGSGYKVTSSMGHIRDLPSKGMSVDIENGFEPDYQISPDKKKVVSELRKLAKSADEIILASDEDREGEAIAWHLCHALKIDPKKTKRIVFREITKPAIQAAIKSPRTVSQSLVDAQQARRILDRIVGYELSPVLWKKVQRGLSAGRVQSVAVRLINDREKEIEAHAADASFRVRANFDVSGTELPAELDSKLDSKDKAHSLLQKCLASGFKIAAVKEKPGTRRPSAPFTTSTLQQEASRRLGYSVRQTMQLAQRLYEAGHITYMRTDSIALSGQAISDATKHIEATLGKEYVEARKFVNKNSGAQEAHEAVRPTNFSLENAGNDEQQKKLYGLIRRRALASQMSPAKIKKTEIHIPIEGAEEQFVAKGEVLIFDGFLAVYGGAKDDVILPELSVNDSLTLRSATAREIFSKPPARYSEASLVRKLEELGIGRPSTYAPTISTIQDRGYVERVDVEPKNRDVWVLTLSEQKISESQDEESYGGDKNKLLPTPLADMVTVFLSEHFVQIMDYGFTSSVEQQFDQIADGDANWVDVLKAFYKDFHPLVEAAENVSRAEVSNMREIGIDPKDGKTIFSRMGRYGPMLQKGRAEDSEEKPLFAPMPEDASITTVTLDQALKMFELPRVLGTDEDSGEEIKANIGRYGPYVQIGKTYVSIKDDDPRTITLERALEVITDKKAADKKKVIAEWGELRILNGPYGPYVTNGKKNARIAKDTDPKTIDEATAKEMIKNAKPGRKRRKTRKK